MSVSDAIGASYTVELDGTTYHLAPIDHMKVIAQYQDHLRSSAFHEVDRIRVAIGAFAGDVAMRAYLDNCSLGVYDFGSPHFVESLRYPKHQKALLHFSLLVHQSSISRAVSDDIFKRKPEAARLVAYGPPAPEPDEGKS